MYSNCFCGKDTEQKYNIIAERISQKLFSESTEVQLPKLGHSIPFTTTYKAQHL